MPHILYQFFGWPNGLVWGNVAAEPIIAALTGAVLFTFRSPLSKQMAKWRAQHHQHIKDHITAEIDQLRKELKGDQ